MILYIENPKDATRKKAQQTNIAKYKNQSQPRLNVLGGIQPLSQIIPDDDGLGSPQINVI